jgi:tripartite-type tricarboxylate transporter receptor subunit TctC
VSNASDTPRPPVPGRGPRPKDVIAKLNGAVVSTLNDPAIRKKLAEQSYEVGTREEQTPEYLGKFHKAEIEKWWPIIKAANIKGE